MRQPHITKRTVASKYRQGNGWIVTSYDPTVNAWRISSEMTYWAACNRVRDRRSDWDTKTQSYNEARP